MGFPGFGTISVATPKSFPLSPHSSKLLIGGVAAPDPSLKDVA